MFQLTAARRRLGARGATGGGATACFNSQPPEGGWAGVWMMQRRGLSFNSQPPEGGWAYIVPYRNKGNGFNSQPPEGGWLKRMSEYGHLILFQLTAARRRLAEISRYRHCRC